MCKWLRRKMTRIVMELVKIEEFQMAKRILKLMVLL
jgi:hypothetical protein